MTHFRKKQHQGVLSEDSSHYVPLVEIASAQDCDKGFCVQTVIPKSTQFPPDLESQFHKKTMSQHFVEKCDDFKMSLIV